MMAKIKKLACDRCDLELSEPEDIESALLGMEAWEAACRTRGVEPRGIIPCQNYMRCGGEILPVVDRKVARWSRRLMKLLIR